MSEYTSADFQYYVQQTQVLDLGYRWSSGELSDWEVLCSLVGSAREASIMVQSEGHNASLVETRRAWKQAGDAWDWALDPESSPPWGVQEELNKLD